MQVWQRLSSDDEGRLRTAGTRFLIVAAGILGVISAVATLVPVLPWEYWAALGLLGTVIALFWAVRTPRHPPVIGSDFEGEKDALEVPMSYDMLRAAVQEAHQVYGHDALPLSVVKGWWARNQWAFAVLKSEYGEYLGYFDLLPVSGEWAERFVSGEIEESEMPPESILPPGSRKEAKILYFSSIAVMEHGTEQGKRRTAKMIWGLAEYMVRYYGTEPRRVIAIAATDEGARLLKSFGGHVIEEGASRKDKHDLYEVIVTPELVSMARDRTMHRTFSPKVSFKAIETSSKG